MTKPIHIEGTNILKPLYQGKLDGLCGLYATINVLRLASFAQAPLAMRHANALAQTGFDFLERKKRLHRAVSEGMGGTLRIKLARHLVSHANTISTQTFEMHPLSVTPDNYTQVIETEIKAGRPVCITLNGALDHFTVICGFSQTQFYMFDSDGLTRVFRTSCRLKGKGQKPTRYRINHGTIFSVGVVGEEIQQTVRLHMKWDSFPFGACEGFAHRMC